MKILEFHIYKSENNEKHKILKLHIRIMQLMKKLKFHWRITKIMKILIFSLRITKIIRIQIPCEHH